MISEICEIISSVALDAKDAKDAKLIQKVAGDIEAIEKISDILIAQKMQDDDVEMLSAD